MDQMEQNALGAAPQGVGGLPDGPAPAGAPPGPPDLSQTPPDELHAQYAKLRTAEKTLEAVQTGLVTLAKLGDTVTMEDLIRESGVLVAHGLDPMQMAGMLADAPEKGDLLSEWVDQHLQETVMRSSQLEFVTRAVRQELGVRAMRGLMLQHAENGEAHDG